MSYTSVNQVIYTSALLNSSRCSQHTANLIPVLRSPNYALTLRKTWDSEISTIVEISEIFVSHVIIKTQFFSFILPDSKW